MHTWPHVFPPELPLLTLCAGFGASLAKSCIQRLRRKGVVSPAACPPTSIQLCSNVLSVAAILAGQVAGAALCPRRCSRPLAVVARKQMTNWQPFSPLETPGLCWASVPAVASGSNDHAQVSMTIVKAAAGPTVTIASVNAVTSAVGIVSCASRRLELSRWSPFMRVFIVAVNSR